MKQRETLGAQSSIAKGLLAGTLLAIVTGCSVVEKAAGGSTPPEDRLSQAASQSGTAEFTRASATEEQVWVTHSADGKQLVTTGFKGDPVTTQPDTASTLDPVKPLPISTLTAGLDQRVPDCKNWRLEATSTPAGAVVQRALCDGGKGGEWLDGKTIPEISQWDEKSVDTVLAEARATLGGKSLDLAFVAEGNSAAGGKLSARFSSLPQKTPDGRQCPVSIARHAAPGSLPLIQVVGCGESLGKEVDLTRLSGKVLMAAIEKASQQKSVQPGDWEKFTVLGGDGGKVTLQLSPKDMMVGVTVIPLP
ncbi:hypothetical protein M3G03_10485 [Aestuariimicrobium sp. p3-SID1156]|uniref:hypothetical protein n=1 Tax=Aestuariimicrobium sp. p3-SID1156 TaxID=2916038 RepID=UPI00223B17C1|nr:hypothetical protein [Aestuariimicrobium sp. p3-SID1156]MCT1459955.1 hypothetical protein [Aestuariimicrobium sp. p3-SID1156]